MKTGTSFSSGLSRENLALILDSTAEAICMMDSNGCLTYCNSTALKILGYDTPDELIGKEMHGMIHHSHADGTPHLQSECPVFKAFRKGERTHIDHDVFWTRNGTSFPAEFWSYPVYEDNIAVGAVITFFNTSDRKQAEKLVSDREEKFRAIFRNNGTAIAIIETDTLVSMVNDACCQLMGYPKEELIGSSWTQYIHPSDIDRLRQYNQNRIANPESAPETYEFTFFTKTREVRTGLISVSFIQTSRQFIISFIDITSRKETELALKKSEEKFKAIANYAASWEGWFDNTGKLIWMNPFSLELTGYSPDEYLAAGDFLTMTVFPDDLSRVGVKFAEAAMGGSGFHEEFRVLRKDGTNLWVSCSWQPMLDESGTRVGFRTSTQDISELKVIEMALTQSQTKLKESIEAKDKFFSILAHDLRSPFGAFLNLTRVMAEDLHDMSISRINELVVNMGKSAENLFEMLENLLEWSRIQRGMIEFEPVMVELKELSGMSHHMLKDYAERKHIGLSFDIPDTLLVYADQRMLESTLRNLITNALKFTPSGGRVTLTACSSVNGAVIVSVQDTGIGMSEEMIDRLFRIDAQVNRTGTDGEPSSGLGLLLCKEFVDKHNGRIRVKSAENRGTTFFVELPGKPV